jgi:tetratricopeptide (TPR) repeat protein
LLESETDDGHVRLFVLRTLREFAMRNGDRAVRTAAIARHARYFADRAEAWHRAARTFDPTTARRSLARERDNLLAVVESVLDGGPIDKRRAEPALRALVALFPAAGEAPPARHLAILRPTMDATHDSGADPLLVARAHLVAGAAHRSTGERAAATRELTRALHIATTIGAPALEGEAMLELARLLHDAGEPEQAHHHVIEALRRFVDHALRVDEASALVVLAELSRARGDHDTARTACDRAFVLFDDAEDLLGRTQAHRAQLLIALDLGRTDECSFMPDADVAREIDRVEFALFFAWSRHVAGDLEGAASDYEQLDERARRGGLSELEALVLASKAALAMEQRAVPRAHALFRSAQAALSGRRPRSMATFFALGAVVDAMLARALATTPPELDPVASTVRRLVDAPNAWPEVEAELRRLGATRFFARLALRSLTPDARARVEAKLPADALVVGEGGRWFRQPGAPVVDLERRKPLARILDRLAEARVTAPDALVSRDALERAGWPGERIVPAAAAHRVRVAISTLRKLGLAGALLTRDDGYLLDPSCRMLREG